VSTPFFFGYRKDAPFLILSSTTFGYSSTLIGMTLIDVALLLRPIGRLGSRLVSLSPKLVAIGPGLVEKATATNGKKIVGRFPNSIDTLRPEARSVVAMNRLPIASSITYYSIIGDRGGNNSPNSSDGVVAYRSSHLEGSRSEKIVPYWHSYVHRSPEGIAEVERILLNP
jgi:hypothetical protein